jgi:uncharacterized membrane protein YkoI
MRRSRLPNDQLDRMRAMPASFVLAALAAACAPSTAQAACFSPDETREMVQRHGLIALNDVVRSARSGNSADLISARLCDTAGNLVYMIAMLGRDGKVMRLTVDARTGDVINHR